MLGKLTRSRSLRTLRKAPPATKDKERTKDTVAASAGSAALSDNSKHIITNSSHPKTRGTMVATDATVALNPPSSAVTPTTTTVAGKADLTASRPSGRPFLPPKSAQAETETIPHGPSELALIPAVSVPRDYVSEVSNGAAENAPRLVSTRPRARTDTQAVLRPKWGDQDRISLTETRPGAIAATTRSGAGAKLMSETKKHQEPDQLEGSPEARLRSKFASFQNSAVPTRSRSMREPPSYTRSLHNRQAALDIGPSSHYSSASASPPSRSTSHSNNHSSHSLATPFTSPPLRSTTTTTITSGSSRTRSISVIYTKPPSSVFFEHHPIVSPLSVTPLATAVSPSRQPSSKQTSSSTSSPNPTPSRSVGLRRAASTKQYDADRSKRHDLVSPLRLSPPDLEKPQLSSLAGQLKRSQSTSSVRHTTCITTSIDAIATAPLSSLNPTNISLHPHQLSRDQDRPSTSSGESFTQPKISSLNSRLSSHHNTHGPIICNSTVAAQTGHINTKAPSTTEPPNYSTDSNMATIPTSSSVTSLVRPKHDFNKRISRDDLYINTRTGKTTFRSYHVPIRGRVPSPKESPRSESPAVTLVRTQTPDSIGEVVDLPIGMALGSPTFVTVGSPAPAMSLNSDLQSKAQRSNRAKDANTFSPMAPTSTSPTTAKVVDAQHEVSPDKAKKWRFFGGRSRSRKHTTEHAQEALSKPGIPSAPVRQSSGDDARRPTTKESRNIEKMAKGTTRITPEEAAMFKPRKTLKRGPSVRLNNKMEISGPTSLQRVPTTVAMPGLDTAAAAATEMHHIDWQSGAQKDSMPSGLLSLNIPDSKFERYSIMFNGILQREGVCSSTLQSEPATSRHPEADDRALFLEKQASLLGRSQTVTSKPKLVEVVNKPQNKDMGRQLTPTRSSTFPIGVKDGDAPAVTASPMSPEQSKSPAFSLFPAAPSQHQKTTIPLASVLSGSTESLPWREVNNQDSKEASKPLAFQHRQTQSPTEIGTTTNNITDVANSPQQNSATEPQKVLSSRAANAHHISSSEVVPFVLVDSPKPVVPKNMPRLRYRNAPTSEATEASPLARAPVTATNLLHALSAAGMTSDATVRAISSDLERQASTASTRSDKNPIVLDNTNAFPQPPAARSANKKSAYVPSSSPIRGPTQVSPIRHMKVQTHNIRNEPHTQPESSVSLKLQTNQSRSRAPTQPFLEAKFEEEPLPHSSPTKTMLPVLHDTKPSVVAMMAPSSESLQMQRSPLGPNTSVLVMESDDEIEVATETAIPQPVPYASSVSAASGASSSATSLNTRQRSESNTTTSSKLTTSTQDEAEIALRNAVEVSIARQISVSRKHRQMLQKSGLIQISPTIKGGRS
ncbi:hypothetical protein HOO65_020702 [Ceratocystis lukuohia]|uniref:Uncharacterized protein n=1 Tax=Ceratocystis lukuohia TaxID=2019550 RepID=A0ABR4MPH3_9PEZI